MKKLLFSVVLVFGFGLVSLTAQEAAAAASPAPSQAAAASPAPAVAPFRLIPHAEIGFTAVLQHLYRSGAESDGNRIFDFVRQGGQDNLYLAGRFGVDAVISGQHWISLVYQPLTFKTVSVTQRNGTAPVQIAGVAFPANTPLDLTYGFDFYRISYLYDFLPESNAILGLGISLQIRNANIVFSSADGSLRVAQNNIGLVPVIRVKAAYWFIPEFGLDFDADGFYASSAIFNGSGKPFEGWIWDAALQVKYRMLDQLVAFLSVRSVGGGGAGNNTYGSPNATSSRPDESTYNALSTLIVSVGVSIE